MITIVGLGALGSHAAQFLRSHKEQMRLIDFDRIEMKNTRAQFHPITSSGANKSTALGLSLMQFFGTKAEMLQRKVTKDNCRELLGGSRVILDCTDNFEARDCIKSYALAERVPSVHGTLSAEGNFGTVIWSERFTPDAADGANQATCEDGDHLPFYTFAASILTIAVTDFLLTGHKHNYHFTPAAITRV